MSIRARIRILAYARLFFQSPGKDLLKRALGSRLVFSVAGYLTVTYHSLSTKHTQHLATLVEGIRSEAKYSC
jgi:hypothetical protein